MFMTAHCLLKEAHPQALAGLEARLAYGGTVTTLANGLQVQNALLSAFLPSDLSSQFSIARCWCLTVCCVNMQMGVNTGIIWRRLASSFDRQVDSGSARGDVTAAGRAACPLSLARRPLLPLPLPLLLPLPLPLLPRLRLLT